MKRKLFYIADFSLPNMSAYALHVLKMCDAFSEKKLDVNLLIQFLDKEQSLKKLKKNYILKNHLNIKGFFKRKLKRNIFTNIYFSIKIFLFLKDKNSDSLILSRSILPSLLLAFMGKKIILEMHTQNTGITRLIFAFFRLFKFNNNIIFVLIHKNLKKILKLEKFKCLILDDCVDVRDFKKKYKTKNSCVYTGSFMDGKGVDTIIKISKKLPRIKFHLYGNVNTLKNEKILYIKKLRNIKLHNFIEYNKIPEILTSNKILLMPYEEKIGVSMKGIDVSQYISPLKLFDYLASGSVIIASKKKVYAHILKNKINSFLVDNYDVNTWCNIISKVNSNKLNVKKIRKNAIMTAEKYTWLKRADKILKC